MHLKGADEEPYFGKPPSPASPTPNPPGLPASRPPQPPNPPGLPSLQAPPAPPASRPPSLQASGAWSPVPQRGPGRPSVLRASCSFAGSLSAFVCQHSIMALALPCKLTIPQKGRWLGQTHWLSPKVATSTLFMSYFRASLTSVCSRLGPHLSISHL